MLIFADDFITQFLNCYPFIALGSIKGVVKEGSKILLFIAKFILLVIPVGVLLNNESLVLNNIYKKGWTFPLESKYYGLPALPTIGCGGNHLVSNFIWKEEILQDKE